MFRTLISLIILLPFVILQEEERANQYTEFDYCTLNCEKDVHSACKCAKTPPRVELHNVPYMEFRKTVLDEHNKWRNHIASGHETRPHEGWIPPAGNMVIMNYDLELEYIIRCRAVKSFRLTEDDNRGHDNCRDRQDTLHVGQNLYGDSANITHMLLFKSIEMWYDEVQLLPSKDIISTYQFGHTWGHFSQVVWWSADRVGCAWVYNPENIEPWKYAFLCNYASTITPMAAGNLRDAEIYKKSETPCDSCPNGRTCGETPEYPALCGKQEPIPDEPPAFIPSGATKMNNFGVYFVIVILYLAY